MSSKVKFAWSYSSLTAFETCPRRFYLTRVAKTVREPESEHLRWGNEVHKAFEECIKGEAVSHPDWFKRWKGICDVVRRHGAAGAEVHTELSLAITEKFKPCDWFADDVWCRGKLDLIVIKGDMAIVFDWKTGKRKNNSDQLALFAALTFIHFPHVKTVLATFVWLKTGEQDSIVFKREQESDIWARFLPRVERMRKAYENGVWPAVPSGLCAKWCPVPSNVCPHSGQPPEDEKPVEVVLWR